MTSLTLQPLGQLLRRSPRYGINAAAVPLKPGVATYLRITDINESGQFAPNPKVGVVHPRVADYKMSVGDLVFARTGASVGKSYLYRPSDGELVYAGFLINIAPDPAVLLPEYLAFFVQTKPYWDWIARTSVRSGQPGVNGREYATLEVPVPSIARQRAVASCLADIDKLIAQLRQAIVKREAILQGLRQQLLTGVLRLPGFSGEWETATLGSISNVAMGQSPLGSTYNTKGNGLPLVQGNADIRDRVTVDRVWTSEPTKTCSAGDVVLTVRAPVGFTAIASRKSCLGRGVCALSAGPDNRFLFHALVYAEPRWGVFEQGSTFTAVNSTEVRNFTLPWPSDANERTAIANVLEDAHLQLVKLQNRLTKSLDIKQGALQRLFGDVEADLRGLPT